ncbi:hypothetical protein V6N11_049232 [Hibiscus sabdariffa]|uniref:Uncharacterized protein n=1 Tax=Hibiscus sabdariffa TaxID=183260 RepID=A0ABR2NKP3_9ROSI
MSVQMPHSVDLTSQARHFSYEGAPSCSCTAGLLFCLAACPTSLSWAQSKTLQLRASTNAFKLCLFIVSNTFRSKNFLHCSTDQHESLSRSYSIIKVQALRAERATPPAKQELPRFLFPYSKQAFHLTEIVAHHTAHQLHLPLWEARFGQVDHLQYTAKPPRGRFGGETFLTSPPRGD